MELEKIIGYKPKDNELFNRAFTHRSLSRDNYEKLEFLGDSILNFVVSSFLFESVDYTEGQLSKARANLISYKHLAKVFDSLGLNKFAKVGNSFKGELTDNIKCDIIEAVIGAIMLDGGLDEAHKFIVSKLDIADKTEYLETDYKTLFQELVQTNNKNTFSYNYEVLNSGKDTQFSCKLILNDKVVSVYSAPSKFASAQECAKIALDKIKNKQLEI